MIFSISGHGTYFLTSFFLFGAFWDFFPSRLISGTAMIA